MPNNMAMHVDFLSAFVRLPSAQQRGVRNLISRFDANPTGRGLNYERIQGVADPAMRSLRIDGSYRPIVMKPERGSIHLLLWAAKHDDAYSWATRRRCDINPATGAVQVYLPQGDAPKDAAAATTKPAGAVGDLKDRELMRLGVPQAILAEVREVADEDALDAIAGAPAGGSVRRAVPVSGRRNLRAAGARAGSAGGGHRRLQCRAQAPGIPDAVRRRGG